MSRKVTDVKVDFIKNNRNLSLAELSAKVNLQEKTVQRVLDKLPKEEPKTPDPTPVVQPAPVAQPNRVDMDKAYSIESFEMKKGSTFMTEAQSSRDDDLPIGPKEGYPGKNKDCVHVFTPNRKQ